MQTETVEVVTQRDALAFEERTYAKVTWRIVPFLMFCYLVAYFDRVNIGFAKLQMSSDLHFSDAVYGLGAGIFFIAYFLVEIPSNIILHRVGARLWMARIMITWGVISSAMAFVTTPTTFYVMRFLLGLAEAGFYPGVILYLSYWYPSHRRGKMFAAFAAAVPLSGLIGGPFSGYLLHAFSGVMNHAGWQWLFFIEGLPSIAAGIAAVFVLTDGIKKAKWLTPEERALLDMNIRADSAHKADPSLREVFTNGRVWLLTAIYFCLICGFYTVGFWLPTLIASTGVKDPLHVGLLTAIPYGAAAVTMLLVSRSADRRRERRWHLAFTAVLGGIGLIMSAVFGSQPVLAMIGLTLAAMGGLSTLPMFWSLPTAFLGGSAAAAGIAMINSWGNLAGFVSPYLIGFIKDMTHSANLGLYAMAGALFIGTLLTFIVPGNVVNR
ncbi:MFS transporter [Paraburkholderia humisilvae]|uniref:Putative tartrate transporter n=1 Tax=Paraburkholderia humisilvae TaxID=627669 RepID=A0A6J5D3G2_9BURK|nr:MFS transporter [Paraburkholderia humisilvae]CAB3748839.1 Putative metabolite transport protein NicT [Paraburkholderia humisilvae]